MERDQIWRSKITAAISSRSCFDKSGAIFTSNGGGPSSAHCISSRAAWTYNLILETLKTTPQRSFSKGTLQESFRSPTLLIRSLSCFLPWSLRRPGVFGDETLITCSDIQSQMQDSELTVDEQCDSTQSTNIAVKK